MRGEVSYVQAPLVLLLLLLQNTPVTAQKDRQNDRGSKGDTPGIHFTPCVLAGYVLLRAVRGGATPHRSLGKSEAPKNMYIVNHENVGFLRLITSNGYLGYLDPVEKGSYYDSYELLYNKQTEMCFEVHH